MGFFPLFFMQATSQSWNTGSGKSLDARDNTLTAMKNTARPLSEEYQHKPRCFDGRLEKVWAGVTQDWNHSARLR